MSFVTGHLRPLLFAAAAGWLLAVGCPAAEIDPGLLAPVEPRPLEPEPPEPAGGEPTPIEAAAGEIEQLRQEVAAAALLRDEVETLRTQVERLELRLSGDTSAVEQVSAQVKMPQREDAYVPTVPFAALESGQPPAGFPSATRGSQLLGSYNYNFGGGYLQLQSRDKEFTFQIQNQITVDGTFYSLRNPDTFEKGFNIPFYRLYFMGNFLEDWEYLASVQQLLGSFNILDVYLGYKFADELHIRVGHFLSPFLYEYWAFSPAWEPVITNSPLYQIAGKRQTGGMLWGKLFDDVVQYQVGVIDGADGAYFDVDSHVDTIGSVTWTPFKPNGVASWDSFGVGFSFQNGVQDYILSDGSNFDFPFGNGEPTFNQNFVNSSGVPFFTYEDDVAADGNRFKIAPHLFWFGRFSFLAEYARWTRALTNGPTQITEEINAYYVNTSYFVTGERYTGDGLLGYTTIEPLNDYGAIELVNQFAQFELGNQSLTPGFAKPGQDATRLQQLMTGINWWPNRYVRLSFDYVNVWTNRAVDVGDGQFADTYGIWWGRAAAFF
jgi:phosphate-selective porin OprO/OprP